MEKPMEETVPAKIVSCKEKSNEDKTIFGILSKIKDIDTKVKPEFESRDTVTFRRGPSLLNKSAYAKLHRSVSPTRSNSVNKIKLKYESDTDVSAKETENTNDKQTLESLKNKYSPASFGYPKIPPKPNLPLPKKRNSKSHIFLPPKKEITESKTRFSLDLDKHKNAEKKDQNSNILRKSLSSSEEYLSIVRQSESEESIDRFQKELSAFTMDKKKRSNSFKKLFTGNFFGKSKKKKEEEKNKTQNVEIGAYRENIQNETHNFNRHSPFRHTTGCTNTKEVRIKRNESEIDEKELERRYAEMHINQFNQAKHNFEKMNSNETPLGYVPMDKPISKTNQQNTYMNMPNIRRYIDTSSSGSTLDSDRSNLNQKDDVDFRYNTNSRRMSDGKRDTPPRAQETRQGVRLVNPKALIPINSERPLPNPYQTNDIRKDEDSSIISQTPRLEETYGTVLDSLPQMRRKEASRKSLNEQEPSRSPNLEPTKLKLPPNREIIPLSPRLKSPIPHEHISTEKLIATELLKPAKSPTPNKKGQRQHSPSHQRLEIDIDYPEDKLLQNHPNSTLTSKPPLAALKKPQVDRNSQHSPQESRERITTSVMVHSSSDRTPTPSSSVQNRSMSPVRPLSVRSATPVDSRVSQSPKTTPQKEEMRRNVEAYYWKEIKKMKDQENYDMYIYQMQDCVPYSYEDPVMVRRSRSLSPTAHRNSRRSLSLPRENKQVTHQQENPYGRHPGSIPEDRAVIHQRNVIHNQNFIRNTPSRQTVDSMPTNYNNYNNSLYRPIFKRGSMNAPPTQQYTENQDKRKVSFSGSQGAPQQSWPTKNGFTKSPPQRRIVERRDSNLDDDVFLPNTPHTNGNEIYGWHNENIYTQRNLLPKEPLYVSRVPNTRYIQNNQQIYGHLPAPRPVLNRTGATRPEESLYGQPVDAIRAPQGLTRHGSMQIPLNGQYVARRTSYENYPVASTPDHRLHLEGKVRREIIINDEIFGQIGGYLPQPNGYLQMRQQSNPVYSSRQSVADSAYGRKQVSVSNKVCDIYGQIHETDRGVQQSGVLMGQLHRNPGSPLVVRQSYNQLPINENFVRNSRLTASANDMYRRGMRSSSEIRSPSNHNAQFDGYVNGPPTRPLPPIPQKKKGPLRNVIVSDTESGSDVSEIQRIMGGNVTVKKRGIFGK